MRWNEMVIHSWRTGGRNTEVMLDEYIRDIEHFYSQFE